MSHYRPEAGGSWLKAVTGVPSIMVYSGARRPTVPATLAVDQFLQVPATLARVFLALGPVPAGVSSGWSIVSSFGGCWLSGVPLLIGEGVDVAAVTLPVVNHALDWDFRITDQFLIVDPGRVCPTLSVTVSGEALVSGSRLSVSSVSSAGLSAAISG